MKTILFILIFLAFILPSLKAQEELAASDKRQLGLQTAQAAPIVTSRIVWSESVNDDFKIFISLPEDYDPSRTEKYPVVYFLDGGSTTFHNLMAELMQAQFVPEVITIGIGYPGSSQRNRDYTSGFIYFYQFLKQELIPQIEEEFNTDPLHRTLFGHSYGGICALFTMFQYFDYTDILFRNIIAASPSIWWPDGQLAFNRERTLYAQTHILPVNLYMATGSLEGGMVTDLEKMQQALERRNYEYFNASYHINQGKDHGTNKEVTFREGIQWVFRQQIMVPTNSNVLAQKCLGAIVYPNPVTDQLHIVIPPAMNARKITCCILDTRGQRVKTATGPTDWDNNLHIPVGDLPKGIYIVQLSNGNAQQNLKFIK